METSQTTNPLIEEARRATLIQLLQWRQRVDALLFLRCLLLAAHVAWLLTWVPAAWLLPLHISVAHLLAEVVAPRVRDEVWRDALTVGLWRWTHIGKAELRAAVDAAPTLLAGEREASILLDRRAAFLKFW
jgi:hypothetical protein